MPLNVARIREVIEAEPQLGAFCLYAGDGKHCVLGALAHAAGLRDEQLRALDHGLEADGMPTTQALTDMHQQLLQVLGPAYGFTSVRQLRALMRANDETATRERKARVLEALAELETAGA